MILYNAEKMPKAQQHKIKATLEETTDLYGLWKIAQYLPDEIRWKTCDGSYHCIKACRPQSTMHNTGREAKYNMISKDEFFRVVLPITAPEDK